jgi:hypothetical protein
MVWVALGVAVVALAMAVAAYRRALGADDTARLVARRPRSWGRHAALLLKRDGPPLRERGIAESTDGRTGASHTGPNRHEGAEP